MVRGREWAAIVLFTMIFVGLACEGGGDSSSDNNANGECVWMSCSEDCPCPSGYHCDKDGDCREDKICGNGICSDDENCSTCPEDCGCGDGAVCLDNVCKEIETCGDGVCNQDQSENCLTCSNDCGCLKGELCNDDNVCVTDTEDPLLDYYWIDGTWKCVEEDGAPGCIIVDTVDVEVTGWDIEQGAAMVLGIKPCPNGFAQKTDSDFLFFGQSETGKTKCNGNFDLTTNIVEFQSVQNHIKTWKYQKE